MTTTTEVGLLGASDSVQLAHVHRERRVLFTHDTDFTTLHNSAVPHSGIIYCHQNRHSVGEIIRTLVSLWSTHGAVELVGRLSYLEPRFV